MLYFTKEGLAKIKADYEIAQEEYNRASLEFHKLPKDIDSVSSVEFANLNLYASQLKKIDAVIKSPYIVIEDMPEYKNWDGATVIRKCEVTLDYDGDVETYRILGTNETDFSANAIACDAPLAERLIGHKVNDLVMFNDSRIIIKQIKPITKELEGPVLGKTL